MVFTKKKNLVKDWMWAVRGHELVPGIQKGGLAMELREDGEPCAPPCRALAEAGCRRVRTPAEEATLLTIGAFHGKS